MPMPDPDRYALTRRYLDAYVAFFDSVHLRHYGELKSRSPAACT